MLLIRMNAAETRASSAMADWTPLAVVSRSSTTAEIETFISDVSTTRTNIAIASSTDSRELLPPSSFSESSSAASIPVCHPSIELQNRSLQTLRNASMMRGGWPSTRGGSHEHGELGADHRGDAQSLVPTSLQRGGGHSVGSRPGSGVVRRSRWTGGGRSTASNVLAAKKAESGLQAFLRQYQDLMQIILVGAAIVNQVVTGEIGHHDRAGRPDRLQRRARACARRPRPRRAWPRSRRC